MEFGHSRYIDWPALDAVGLRGHVEELISVGAWGRFFAIQETPFVEATLEVMATFSAAKRALMDAPDAITFRFLNHTHRISYTQFSVFVGLFDPDYVETNEYHRLPIEFYGDRPEAALYNEWTGRHYDPKSSKGSTFSAANLPHLRYMHALLARTLSGRGLSQGVVETHDMFYLHSMVNRVPIHIGYCLAQFIARKATTVRSRGTIWTGPYITRLLRGMGLLPEALTQQFQSGPAMVPFDLAALRAIQIRPLGPMAPAMDDEAEEADEAEQQEAAPGGRLARLEQQLEQMAMAQHAFYASQATHNAAVSTYMLRQEEHNTAMEDQMRAMINMMQTHLGIGPSSSQFPPPPPPQ